MTRWTSHTLFPLTALAFAAIAAVCMAALGLSSESAAALGLGLFAAVLALRNWWLSEEDRPLLAEELLGVHDAIDDLHGDVDALRGLIDELTELVERSVASRAAGPNALGAPPSWSEVHALIEERLQAFEPALEDDHSPVRATIAALDAKLDAQEDAARKLREALSVALTETKRANARIAFLETAARSELAANGGGALILPRNGDLEVVDATEAGAGSHDGDASDASTQNGLGAARKSTSPAPRAELALSPILTLSDLRPIGFEALYPLPQDGDGLTRDDDARASAVADGSIEQLDTVAFERAARAAEQLASEGRDAVVFCRLSMTSLRNPVFLRRLSARFNTRPELKEKLALGVLQNEFDTASDVDTAALSQIGERGVILSLDGVSDWSVDLERLERLGFRFMKLDVAEFLDRAGGVAGAGGRLVQKLDDRGVALIVENVADEETLDAVRAAGGRLVQGAALAEPTVVALATRSGVGATPLALPS